MPKYPDPTTNLSVEEQQALKILAPVRSTLERLVENVLKRAAGGKDVDPKFVEGAVEAHWTLMLEAYRRGVRTLHKGIHRAEGIDHEMVDEALDFALRDVLGAEAKAEQEAKALARAKKRP